MIGYILLIILVNAIGAVTFPLTKLSLEYGNFLFLTGIRMVIAGALLVAFEYFRSQMHFILNRKTVIALILLSLSNVFITNFLQYWALNYVSAGKAVFIFNTAPFISAVLSYFFFNEQMTVKKVIALIISFAGFLPIILQGQSSPTATVATPTIPWLPEIALFLGAFFSVVGWIAMKYLLRESKCSLILANGLSMFMGGLLFFPTAWLWIGSDWAHVSHISTVVWLTAILIVANNFVNYNGLAYLLKYVSTTLIFLVSFTGPLFALLFGWLFLGEKIGMSFFITIAIVSVGLYMYYSEEVRLKEKNPQMGANS